MYAIHKQTIINNIEIFLRFREYLLLKISRKKYNTRPNTLDLIIDASNCELFLRKIKKLLTNDTVTI
jgi:hypothetical protein